jgi:hypothetical protein
MNHDRYVVLERLVAAAVLEARRVIEEARRNGLFHRVVVAGRRVHLDLGALEQLQHLLAHVARALHRADLAFRARWRDKEKEREASSKESIVNSNRTSEMGGGRARNRLLV